MTVATKVSDQERAQIAALCEAGKTRNEIAEITGRGTGTISRIAHEIGHDFLAACDERTQSTLSRAHEARKGYCAERRAVVAEKLIDEAERLVDEMRTPHVAFNFGGKDNTYEEHEMDEPPIDGKRQLMAAARDAMRTVLDIARVDEKRDDGPAKGLLERIADALETDQDDVA